MATVDTLANKLFQFGGKLDWQVLLDTCITREHNTFSFIFVHVIVQLEGILSICESPKWLHALEYVTITFLNTEVSNTEVIILC